MSKVSCTEQVCTWPLCKCTSFSSSVGPVDDSHEWLHDEPRGLPAPSEKERPFSDPHVLRLSASDFRLLTEAEKYGAYTSALRELAEAQREVQRISDLHVGLMKAADERYDALQSATAPLWVDASVRSPEKEGTYLTLKHGDVIQEVTTAQFYKGNWIWPDGGIIRLTDPDCVVEWWLPLPAAPISSTASKEGKDG